MQTSMEETTQLAAEVVREAPRPLETVNRGIGSLHSRLLAVPGVAKLIPFGCSLADQALAVGGIFLANVALARTQTKEEYGAFALSYSVFTFLSGIHNAAILEPYTVYGSGRYRERFSAYLRLMTRGHALLCLLLSGIVLLVSLLFWWIAPHRASRAFVGLGLTVGVLLSGIFLRRAFYVRRQPALAARSSLVFFITVAFTLWLAMRTRLLDSFSIFLILALGWIVAGARYAGKLLFTQTRETFLEREPGYWGLHWKYSRWVLITAFVFQLTTQGYYWLVAAFLSVKEVGELRAMYNLIAPADQVFIAMCYLVLPAMSAHYAMKRMDNLLSLWKRFELAILAVSGLFALTVRIWGKQLMHVLYAGKFDGLGSVLFALALLPLLMATGNTMALALNAAEKPKLVFYGFLASGIATFVLGIPLVIHFGLSGAVYGMLLSGAVFGVAIGVSFLLGLYKQSPRQNGVSPA
jgi:O-antigen/teichoic acid export membrane protein